MTSIPMCSGVWMRGAGWNAVSKGREGWGGRKRGRGEGSMRKISTRDNIHFLSYFWAPNDAVQYYHCWLLIAVKQFLLVAFPVFGRQPPPPLLLNSDADANRNPLCRVSVISHPSLSARPNILKSSLPSHPLPSPPHPSPSPSIPL